VPEFASYELQYGESHEPGAFSAPIYGPVNAPVVNGQLGVWDTTGLNNGPHTLRVLVRDAKGVQYEARVRVFVENGGTEPPTATWTPPPAPPTEMPTAPPVIPPTEVPTAVPTVVPPPPPAPPTLTPVVEQPTATPEVPTPEPPTATPPPEQPPTEQPPVEPTPTWTPEVLPPAEAPGAPVETPVEG
jgi:hypothetical protein